MKQIIKANIDRFKLLLESEADPTKRAMLLRLLGEQEQQLEAAEKPPTAAGKVV